ncbi:translation initiation factor IF-2 [Ekhidna sp.]
MAEYRLSQVARKLNVGKNTILDFLKEKGHEVDSNPNSKIPQDQYDMLAREFADSAHDKEEASELTIGGKTDNFVINSEKVPAEEKKEDERILIKDNVSAEAEPEKISARTKLDGPKIVGKIDLNKKKEVPAKVESREEVPAKEELKVEELVPEAPKEEPKEEAPVKEEPKKEAPVKEVSKTIEPKEEKVEAEKPTHEAPKEEKKEEPKNEVIKAKADSLRGLKVLDKIELPKDKPKPKPVASSDSNQDRKKRPRKRIQSSGGPPQRSGGGNNRNDRGRNASSGRKTEELSDKEIQDKIKATLAKLSGGGGKGGSQRSKYRKDKRSAKAEAEEERQLQAEEDSKILHVTEYISASDLASLMDVTANDVISACMSLGMFVSINQRLDAETITVIADEFGFEVDFTEAKEETDIVEEVDSESELLDRAPIVTIMGHVDHGKTSLLDYIRDSKVTEGEAGGITQHIGAYDVMTESGKRVAFLDTPGHEAFTAMRARGAKITDVAIIVVAADDSVMPQTKEAINHAQVAGVPIVIAINKVDKPNANPDKIKEDLSQINILVEDWGGKYQCQHVSAKTGEGIDELLDKVLLEAELLELKANPDKPAVGSVVEASLDKGRGYVSTIMVQAGSLRVGDVLLAGPYFGKVKAMFDHRGHKLETAGPSTPVLMLGLDGAPQAGDKFNVMESDREAREVANKREQILREQSIRTKKHITLDEIGRRLAIGSFKELNVIVKGDVDGSIEALADSLLKLSTEEVQVNILHKAVGQISESDVLLASASDAVIVGFQVRPSGGARKLAENEEIEIRLYSIIYDAINDVKDAMEGMLEPTSEEVITGNIEVRDVFKISKVGTVAGCYVTDGNVKRSNQVRLVRDGIVVHTGEINQLKRFKEDVGEVKNGYECGLSIKNFHDIKVGDIIEGFEVKEVKRTL